MAKASLSSTILMCLGASCDVGHADRVERLGTEPGWLDLVEMSSRDSQFGPLFVVEGDIGISSLEALRDYYVRYLLPRERGMRSTVSMVDGEWNIWDRDTALELTYCIGYFSNPDHVDRAADEMKVATKAWEDVANVMFRSLGPCSALGAHVPAPVFTVEGWFGGGACATFPEPWGSGCPVSDVLLINFDYYDALQDETRPTPGVLMHELGHKLGLVHEHYHPDGGCSTPPAGSVVDPLTSELDPLSVMLGSEECGTPPAVYAVSQGDGVGLRELYGMPVSWYAASGII